MLDVERIRAAIENHRSHITMIADLLAQKTASEAAAVAEAARARANALTAEGAAAINDLVSHVEESAAGFKALIEKHTAAPADAVAPVANAAGSSSGDVQKVI